MRRVLQPRLSRHLGRMFAATIAQYIVCLGVFLLVLFYDAAMTGAHPVTIVMGNTSPGL